MIFTTNDGVVQEIKYCTTGDEYNIIPALGIIRPLELYVDSDDIWRNIEDILG